MKYLKAVLGMIVLVALDQLAKFWAVKTLMNHAVSVIKGVFEFHYLENRGIAFGLFQNKFAVFIFFTIIILAVIVYLYIKFPDTKRLMPIRVCFVVLASGAVGNLIDRILHNYVIDFLYFKWINFPIFNIADCYVTIAMIVLFLLILFYYKEDEITLHRK